MTSLLDVDVDEMPHDPHRPSDEPRPGEADSSVPTGAAHDRDPAAAHTAEPDDDLRDEDAAVQALLGAISTRLTEPPDELTRRRHLVAMRRTGTRSLLLRVAQRTGTAAAVALVAGGVLAGGGLLPDQIQREVADRAAQVGIELPRPASPDEAGDPRDADEASTTVEPAAPEVTPPPERMPEGVDGHGSETGGETDGAAGVPSDVADADEPPGPVRAPDAPDDGPDAPRLPEAPSAPDLHPDDRRHLTPIEPPLRPDAERPDREPPRTGDDAESDRPGGGLRGSDHDDGDADRHEREDLGDAGADGPTTTSDEVSAATG